MYLCIIQINHVLPAKLKREFDKNLTITLVLIGLFAKMSFYYGETIARLKRLQKHKLESGISSITHGNIGRRPSNACSEPNKIDIQTFIVNYAATHGMPDPGREPQNGQGRLRILLPSILNDKSVHLAYELSLQQQNKPSVGYRTFMRCWQESNPHIVFSKPRTDLCMTASILKKKLIKSLLI